MDNQKIKEDILRIWKHAGLDAEVDARTLAKKLGEDPDLTKAGIRSGRQLQHPQVGEKFGREGVLGAISNNIDGVSLKDIADKNNVATKKINAGLITRIVYSILDNDSKKSLLFPVMYKPIINYFLGKLFGDRKITPKEYKDGIKGLQINESTGDEMSTRYNIKQYLVEEGVVDHVKNNYGKYLAGAGALGVGAIYANGDVSQAIDDARIGAAYVDGRGGDLIDQGKAAISGAQHGYDTPSKYDKFKTDVEQNNALKQRLDENPNFLNRIQSNVIGNQFDAFDKKLGYQPKG